jgi:predicted  nucleic acid-binding Zn-ribbon protein
VDVKTFCESAGNDLIAWKAKLYDVIRKTENLDQVDKDKIVPLVKNLNQLVDDVDNRIRLLDEECPLEWDSQKTEIQEKLSQVKTKYSDLDGAMDVWNMNLETPR